jgi:hypothetical protein
MLTPNPNQLIASLCKKFQPKSARIQSTPFLVLMASVSSFGVSEHHISAPWTILDPLGPKNVALSPFFYFFQKKVVKIFTNTVLGSLLTKWSQIFCAG